MQLKAFKARIVVELEKSLLADFSRQEASLEANAEAAKLLCTVLKKDKSFLFAYSDYQLAVEQLEELERVLQRRLSGEPLAYIFNEQEFWSLPFYVDANVLIPRADTECIVEAALNLVIADNATVVDLGTGSGAIAIVLQREKPNWRVLASDQSFAALKVAKKNTAELCGERQGPSLFCGDWLEALHDDSVDLIVSNPPYIEFGDKDVASLTRAEPSSALYSDRQGTADLQQILVQALRCTKERAWVLLEHGAAQSASVAGLAEKMVYKNKSFVKPQVVLDLSGRQRAFLAQVACG